MRHRSLITALFCLLAYLGHAGNEDPDTQTKDRKYPVPQRNENLLFFVQRTHNRNTVVYELNMKADGRPDGREPLLASWIRYEEGGVRKKLSYIQNRVYGLDIKPLGKDGFLVHFRSYNKRDIFLLPTGKNRLYKAMMMINGRMAELTNLFICTVTNSLGIPSVVKYIDISGIDPATDAVVTERVIP
jgi:hypothetical protein